jgi:hypothetical protein
VAADAKKTVFISSTYADLADHRREVWGVLESFRVTVRGMERFGARPEAPLDTCLAEVDQSDVYVGVLGFRLGSVDQRSGKSFTQLEYERALARDLAVLIYIADEETALVRHSDIELDVARREALAAFKRALRDRHTISQFTSPEDLAGKVRQDFRRYFVERPEKRTTAQQELEDAGATIDRFFLLPAELSGTDVRLRVEVTDEPFAAARALCEPFYLNYGSTIGVRIKVLEPKNSTARKFTELYASGERAKALLALAVRKAQLDLYCTLKFSPKDVTRTHAELIGYSYHRYEQFESDDSEYVAPEGRAILLYAKPAPPDAAPPAV